MKRHGVLPSEDALVRGGSNHVFGGAAIHSVGNGSTNHLASLRKKVQLGIGRWLDETPLDVTTDIYEYSSHLHGGSDEGETLGESTLSRCAAQYLYKR
jgi:hypothetical protein